MTATHQCRPIFHRVVGTQPSEQYDHTGFHRTMVVLEADCVCGKDHAWNAGVDIKDLTVLVPWFCDHEIKTWATEL